MGQNNFCGQPACGTRSMQILPRQEEDCGLNVDPQTDLLRQQLQEAQTQIKFFKEELMRVKQEN